MANFVYSFDTGLYDISNHSDEGYPWKSGPIPIKNTTGYTNTKKGEIYCSSGQIAHVGTGTVTSPLSDGNNGMQFLTGGRLKDGSTIIGALYNFRTTSNGNPSQAISAAPIYYHLLQLPEPYASGWHLPVMRISAGYHGTTMALVTNDNRTIIYDITVKGAASSTTIKPKQLAAGVTPLSGFNTAVGPNLRRKVALGYA